MNSERRHELQQNELAAYLERINKVLDPYKYYVACGVAAVFCIAIGWGFIKSGADWKRTEATLALIYASGDPGGRDAEVFGQVGDDFPGTAAGARARLYQADLYLEEGIRTLYTNREDAEGMLDQATGVYREAIAGSNDVLIQSRAHFGIARAAEARGDVEAAIEAYEECLAINESKAMNKKIQGRIDSLGRPETGEFFAWFADQDFSSTPLPPPGMPDPSLLPEDPGPSMGFSPLDLGGDDRELGDGGLNLPTDSNVGESTDKETPGSNEGDSTEATESTEAAESTETPKATESSETAESGEATESGEPAESGEAEPTEGSEDESSSEANGESEEPAGDQADSEQE